MEHVGNHHLQQTDMEDIMDFEMAWYVRLKRTPRSLYHNFKRSNFLRIKFLREPRRLKFLVFRQTLSPIQREGTSLALC